MHVAAPEPAPAWEGSSGEELGPELKAVIVQLKEEIRAIAPDRLYTPEEAADLLAIRSFRAVKTLGEIPRRMLPVVPVGPGGGLKRYWGRDLIRYIESVRRTK